jgi:hypothetical protein
MNEKLGKISGKSTKSKIFAFASMNRFQEHRLFTPGFAGLFAIICDRDLCHWIPFKRKIASLRPLSMIQNRVCIP